jgi:hypothetical protein
MPYGAARCPHCGLSLEGPLAAELFTTLSRADQILGAMRTQAPVPAARVTAGAPPVTTTPPPAPGAGTPVTTTRAVPVPPVPPRSEHTGLGGASVPRILLALGALCLLVAALVFLAVAWSAMGVAGRTATLVGFTVVAGGLSAWAARRDLRAAAESLSVVALGLLVFDVFGARSAGWLGDLGVPSFLVVLGTVLALAGAGAAVAVRRTPVRVLRGAEVFASLGVACAVSGLANGEWLSWSAALTLAVVLTAAVALLARSARLTVMSVGSGVLCLVTWFALALSSWDRALAHPSLRGLWGGLEVWPLLVTAAFAGVVALVPRLALGARVAALAVAVVVLAGAALAPTTDETVTVMTAAGAVLVLLLSVGAWFVPQPWRRSLGSVAGLGLLWMAVAAAVLAVEGVRRIVEAGTPPWSGAGGDAFPARLVGTGDLASWLLPALVVAGTAAVVAVARSFAWADRVVAPLMDAYVLVALAAATVVLTLASYPVALWLVTAALLATCSGLVAAALLRRHALPLALGAVFLAGGLVLGLHAEWLTLATLVVLLVCAGVVHLRWPALEVSVAAGALVAGAAAGLVWTVGSVSGARAEWTSVATLLVLAALVLGGPYVDERVRLSSPSTYARLGTETGALVAAGVVSLAGVNAAAWSSRPGWAAAYLTLTGATVSAMALLRVDRRLVGWLGGFLLVLASWVRLADLGVDAPEAYTLPSALALLVVGVVHLRRDARTGTMVALAPGLLLALLPSLMWVLAEPVALRSVLLGLACLALVIGGARLRWSAPLVIGAAVGALLVLRYAVPVFEGIPQWVLIGAAGVLLVVVGITWEQRVRDARRVAGYVRGLR